MDKLTTDMEVGRGEQDDVMGRLWVRKEIIHAYKRIAASLNIPLQVLIMRILMEGLEHFGVFDDPRGPMPPPPPERPLPKLPPLAGHTFRKKVEP